MADHHNIRADRSWVFPGVMKLMLDCLDSQVFVAGREERRRDDGEKAVFCGLLRGHEAHGRLLRLSGVCWGGGRKRQYEIPLVDTRPFSGVVSEVMKVLLDCWAS